MTPDPSQRDARPFSARLWTYQATRFPLKTYGLLILAFAISCVCFGALTRGGMPTAQGAVVAIIVVFLLFMQLRIADEHRDFEDDKKWHPERPVPAGVVSLKELQTLAAWSALVQLALVMALHPPLLALLMVAWIWVGLVWHDFFAKRALKKRPALSLLLHLGVLPAFAMAGAGADQLAQDELIRPGLLLFMGLTIATGAALEISRKCRPPEGERPEVMTYSNQWGPKRAGMAAAFAYALAVAFGALAFTNTGVSGFWFLPAAGVGFWAFLRAAQYAEQPTEAHALAIGRVAVFWVILAYLSLGVLPFLVRALT